MCQKGCFGGQRFALIVAEQWRKDALANSTRCVTSVAICFPYASFLIPIEHRTKRHCHTTEMHSFYKVAAGFLHKLTFYVERATRWVSIWINFVSVELLRIIHSTRGLQSSCKARVCKAPAKHANQQQIHSNQETLGKEYPVYVTGFTSAIMR